MIAFSLPSLHTLDTSSPLRFWLCTGRTDVRCGFDRLAAMAEQVIDQHPLSGHLFVLRGRSGDRLKILYWDRDGFVLFYKRLKQGQFKLPKAHEQAAERILSKADAKYHSYAKVPWAEVAGRNGKQHDQADAGARDRGEVVSRAVSRTASGRATAQHCNPVAQKGFLQSTFDPVAR